MEFPKLGPFAIQYRRHSIGMRQGKAFRLGFGLGKATPRPDTQRLRHEPWHFAVMSETESAIIRSWIDILAFDRLDDRQKRVEFWSDITIQIQQMSNHHIKTLIFRYPDFVNIVLNHTTPETYEGNHEIWRSAVRITMKFIAECGLLLWLEVYFSPDEVLENSVDVLRDVSPRFHTALDDVLVAFDLISELVASNGNWQIGCAAKLGDLVTGFLSRDLNERESSRLNEKISSIILHFSRHLLVALTTSHSSSNPKNKRNSTLSTVIEFYCFLFQDRSLLNHPKIINTLMDRMSQFSFVDESAWKEVENSSSENSEDETTCAGILSRSYHILSILFHRISDRYSSQSRAMKVMTQSLFPSLCRMISCPMSESCAIACLQLLTTLGKPLPSLSLSHPSSTPTATSDTLNRSSIKQEQLWTSNDFSSQYRHQFILLLESLSPSYLTSVILGMVSMYESLSDLFVKLSPSPHSSLLRTYRQLNCLATVSKWRIDILLTGAVISSPDERDHLLEALRILRVSRDQLAQKFEPNSSRVVLALSPTPTSAPASFSAYDYLASDESDNDQPQRTAIVSRTDLIHLQNGLASSASGPFTSSTVDNNHSFRSAGSVGTRVVDLTSSTRPHAENPFKIRNERLNIGKEDKQTSDSSFSTRGDRDRDRGTLSSTKTINSDDNWLTKLQQRNQLLDLRPAVSPSKESQHHRLHVAAKTIQREEQLAAQQSNKRDLARRAGGRTDLSKGSSRNNSSEYSSVSGGYFGDVLDTHGDFNYEADLDKGYEHLFAAPKQDQQRPISSVPDVASLLGSMMAASSASHAKHSSTSFTVEMTSSRDRDRDRDTSTPQPQKIIKISVDSFFLTLLSLPLKSFAISATDGDPSHRRQSDEEREDDLDGVVVPNRFINEDHYIRTFQKLLEAEVEAIIKEFIVMNGMSRGGGGNRRDQREMRLWGGAEMKPQNGRPNELSLPRIFVRCALIVDRPGYEETLSEARVGTVHTPGNSRGANLAKDDLIIILHPNDDHDYKNVQAVLRATHTLGIVVSQGKEQSSAAGSSASSSADDQNDYNHQSIVVLKGTLPPSEATWTCIPLIGLSTHMREWTALHSIVSHQVMPLTPYILKAAPVVSAHRLSEIYRKLETSVGQIMVGTDRTPRQEDLDRVNALISLLDGFQVDISVLKAVDMVNLCKQIESRKGIDTLVANRLKDLRTKWKHQVFLAWPISLSLLSSRSLS
jgi:hypothetical protein